MASITISRETPLKTLKETPFMISLFFLFLYVSVFYACSLSPSSVVHNSTFWFFISNTLIFIIAVDYGAFSPPRQKLVVYLRQEYYHPRFQTNPIVFEKPERNHTFEEEEEEEEENPENGLIKSVVGNDPENPNEDSVGNHILPTDSSGNNALFSVEKTKNHENPVEESEPEKVEREETIEESEDQLSKLTDEELNRRIEEFIEKFNRQIKLQKIQEKLQKSGTF